MTTIDVERLLRLPAPDEPAVLPALVLPRATATGELHDRSLDTTLGMDRFTLTMRIALAAALLLAGLAGALATGAIRLQQLQSPLLRAGEYTGHGVSLTYPSGWERVTPDSVLEDGSSVALIASNTRVDGCSEAQVGTLAPEPASLAADGVYYAEDQLGKIYSLGDRIYACMIQRPMRPGEIRIVLTQNTPQRVQVGAIGDFEEAFFSLQSQGDKTTEVPGPATGFTETIAGMPALLSVRDHSVIPGADEVRTWVISGPDWMGSMWHVQAVIAGPDLPGLREQADTVARSFAYLDPPPPLEEAGRDAALAAIIDDFDRQMRRYPGSRLAACFPRAPGEVAATVAEGPDGPLGRPVEVTCTTTVEPTAVRLWRATIAVSWPARDGAPAGRWGWELQFQADGTGGSQGQLFQEQDKVAFPGAWNTPLPPGPLPALAPGTLVRAAGPDIQMGMYNHELTPGGPSDSQSQIGVRPGQLMVAVKGPVTDDGLDFYLFDDGVSLGWAVPTADGRPLVEVVSELSCPTAAEPMVEDLAYLSPLVRRLCYGDRELAFGPAQFSTREDVTGDPTMGEPAWLALALPTSALFGSGGASGVDAGLPALLAPGVRRPAPGDWITVRGHFNDPAATTCTFSYPEEWQLEQAPPDMQHRRCAEHFVITSIEPTEAP